MASTDSKLTKLKFLPGFHKESTQYSEEGKWFEGNRVRFREGKPENLRGYIKHNSETINGIARDLLTWSDNDTRKHIIFVINSYYSNITIKITRNSSSSTPNGKTTICRGIDL